MSIKKISYILLFLFVCVFTQAQTLWPSGVDASFDTWSGSLPTGWTNYNSGSTILVNKTVDRFGKTDKACVIKKENNDDSTWRFGLMSTSDITIPSGSDFYYTFWAKADTETSIYMGISSFYDTNWGGMPKINLTTEWKKYTVVDKVPSGKTGGRFVTHLRLEASNINVYLDNIVLETGTPPASPTGSLWNDNVNGDFNDWQGTTIKGWSGTTYNETMYTYLTPTDDRNGEENKACKITSNYNQNVNHWYSWHLAATTTALNIPEGTYVYYTFWAKSDVNNQRMYIGTPQLYDPNGGNQGWDNMPYVEVTADWKKYGVIQYVDYTANQFSIQLRGKKTLYIDDIELVVGNTFPENIELEGAVIPAALIAFQNPGSLSNVKRLRLSGNYNEIAMETLMTALGNNSVITNIEIEATSLTNFDNNYFSSINPNCLIYVPEGITSVAANVVKRTIVGSASDANVTFDAISEIRLTDKEPFYSPFEVKTNTSGVSYSRQCYNDANWESIILPFAVSEFDQFADYTVEKYTGTTGTNNDIINFEAIESLDEWGANTAYLMKSNAASSAAEYTFANRNAGITVQTAAATNGFTGVYNLESGENRFFLNTDGTEFGKGNAQSTIPPFRAFYVPTQQNGPAQYSVAHKDNGTTGISTVNEDKEQNKPRKVITREGVRIIVGEKVYTLEGKLTNK